MINGTSQDFFFPYGKGVHQGDPLSPLLSNLGVNILAFMCGNAVEDGWFEGWRTGEDDVKVSIL